MPLDDRKLQAAQELLAYLPGNEVARRLGISRDTVQRIHRGERVVTTDTLAVETCSGCQGTLTPDGRCVRCRAIAARNDSRAVREAIESLPRKEVLEIVARNTTRRPTRAQRLAGLHDPFVP